MCQPRFRQLVQSCVVLSLLLCSLAASAADFGDLPDNTAGTTAPTKDPGDTTVYHTTMPDYETLSANGGPSHTVDPDLYIGSVAPDDEADGQPDATAVGDGAEDDGVDMANVPVLSPSMTEYSLDVTVTNNKATDATLYGWIDQNRDGDFDDAGEFTSQTVAASVGSTLANLDWDNLDGNGEVGTTGMRLRLTTDTLIQDDWQDTNASDGEIEDYQHRVQLYIFAKPFQANSLSGGYNVALFASYFEAYWGTGNVAWVHEATINNFDLSTVNLNDFQLVFYKNDTNGNNEVELPGTLTQLRDYVNNGGILHYVLRQRAMA